MKVIILAAGYATRLGKLTENTPKGLLPVRGKILLDYLMDEIDTLPDITQIYLVTNAKYYKNFTLWQQNSKYKNVQIINDFTTSNQDRLGAIGDIQYVIEKTKLNDDVLIAVSDNFFNFKLLDFYNFYKKANCDCVLGQQIDELEILQRIGVATIDKTNTVTLFEEKPVVPKGNIGIWGIYFYQKSTTGLFKKYLMEGNPKDSPGNFVPWLIKHKKVKAFVPQGEIVIDIGTPESYAQVNQNK